MSAERVPVRFYQVGSFAVGNRLVSADRRNAQSDPQRANSLTSGHRACAGCGEALGARYALDAATRVTNGQLVAVNATGCLEVFSTPYPETSWQLPWLHSLFANSPSVATGVAAGLRSLGKSEVRVVAQGLSGSVLGHSHTDQGLNSQRTPFAKAKLRMKINVISDSRVTRVTVV